MNKELLFSFCLLSQLVVGCTCSPPNREFSVYESTYRHTPDQPVTFTILNRLPIRKALSDGTYGELYRKPEERPEYSEVYVVEETETCQITPDDCRIVWKAETKSNQSPWKITYGKDGESLKTVEGPKQLAPGRSYRLIIGHRTTGCIREIGWLTFQVSASGKVHPLEYHSEERDWMSKGSEPAQGRQTNEYTKNRLNRLAKQYEKLNGHLLRPLSYVEEM